MLLFVYGYVFGGITFLPLCLVLAYIYFLYFMPADPLPKKQLRREIQDDDLGVYADEKAKQEYNEIKVSEIEENLVTGVNVLRSGWLTVTTEYYEFPQNSVNDRNNEPESSKSAYTTLYKLVRKKSSKGGKDESEESELELKLDDKPATSNANSTGTTTATASTKKRKNKYFAVLRHGNLFLYKDQVQADVLHVIVLSNHVVSLWPRSLPDGQLFSKMSAICVLRKDISKLKSQAKLPPTLPPKDSAALIEYKPGSNQVSTLDILENGEIPPKQATFYIYCDNNYDKEDWYFDLIRATKRENSAKASGSTRDLLDPNLFAKTFHPKTADMISLIQNLHSSEGQLHSRWFNALIGRVFLALYGTQEFENYIKNKLLLKLKKINRPGFLDEFKIEKVFIGRSAPLLKSPKLTKLSPEGELEVESSIFYNGGISFQISTKVNINLGTRIKPRDISILLDVTVKLLHGEIVFKMKKPPSERIWWGFKEMPAIEIVVEPVVSARQITTGMITRTIENKLKESIRESLVLPAMDDITFFSTKDEIFRGGIWDKSQRPDVKRPAAPEAAAQNWPDLESTEPKQRTSSFSSSAHSELFDEEPESIDSLPELRASTMVGLMKDVKEGSQAQIKKSISKASVAVSSKLKKSNSTVKVSSDQFLADGSFIHSNSSVDLEDDPQLEEDQLLKLKLDPDSKSMSNSFKRIGKWYFKEPEEETDPKTAPSSPNKLPPSTESSPKYRPPEMISSRRAPRAKNRERSTSDLTSNPLEGQIARPNISVTSPPVLSQPYGKIPEMSFPTTHSPAQFISGGQGKSQENLPRSLGSNPPILPARKDSQKSGSIKKPPPKTAEDYQKEPSLI